jgi:hypothetical protein
MRRWLGIGAGADSVHLGDSLGENWPDWVGWIVGVEGLVVGREFRAVARFLLSVESTLIHV